MTVSTLTNKVTYFGNGSATSFAVPFKVLDVDHLVVQRRVVATGVIDHTYTGTQYSYSGLGNDSGTLTLSGAALSATYELVIERVVPYTQDLDIVNAGGFYPETVEEQLDLTTMQIQQVAEQVDDVETRALMVPAGEEAPSYEDFAAAFQGDPGGNIESLGLFSALLLPVIPAGTYRVRTSGHTEEGWGAADYAHDPNASPAHNAAYVADNPTSSFLAADGRAFVLSELTPNPAMFGTIGFKRGVDTDLTCNDDSDALQDFFNYFQVDGRRHLTGNLDGREWMISKTIYATYPVWPIVGSLERHTLRSFTGGSIRALPLSRQTGGVPMDYALVIGGHHQCWDGLLYISGFDENGTCPAWADMRLKNGIRLFFATQSLFAKCDIEGVKRDGVYYDPSEASTTFQAGTDFEVTYNYSNNIGVRFEHLFVREFGTGSMAPGNISKSWTLRVHGGMPVGGPFDPDHAAYVSSNRHLQRTKLTFDTTENFRKYDPGKVRLELGPATYGTLAFDATAGTVTWSTGDPVAANLVVDDVIIPQSGLNAGKRLQIISFSGTSNRVIKVSSSIQSEELAVAMVDEAATAITGLYTRWAYYFVTDVLSATEVLVWPWMEDRVGTTGKWNFAAGFAANVTGSNTTTVSFGNLCALNGAWALNSQSLYGPKADVIRSEATEGGILQGYSYTSSNLGLIGGYMHCELCEVHICQMTVGNSVDGFAQGASNLFKSRIYAMENKAAAGDPLMPYRALNNFTLIIRGEVLSNRMERSFSGVDTSTFPISNLDTQRYAHRIMNGPQTCNLSFYHDTGRLAGRHNFAEVTWVGPTGAAPTGDMTFALSTDMTLRGWAIVGTNPVSGPAKPCKIVVDFYEVTKKAILTRFDAV